MSSKSQQYSRLLASFPTRNRLSTALWVNRYAGAVDRQPVAAHKLTHTRFCTVRSWGMRMCIAHKPPAVTEPRNTLRSSSCEARHTMQSPLQAQLTRETADKPTEATAYGVDNTVPPLSNLPAYAGVSLGMRLWTKPQVLAYRAINPCPSLIRYDTIHNLHSMPLLGRFSSEYCHDVQYGKLEWCGYPKEKNFENMFIHFDRIHECDRQTDGHCMTAQAVLAQHHAAKITKNLLFTADK